MDFGRFWAERHTLRANCLENSGDTTGHPAYEIFSIKRRFQKFKSRFFRFKETRARERQRAVLA